jgi:DnaJ-class molecular chaperone
LVLGVDTEATVVQLKAAYRKLALTWHPDRAAPEDRAAAEARFKQITAAYKALLAKGVDLSAPAPKRERAPASDITKKFNEEVQRQFFHHVRTSGFRTSRRVQHPKWISP